MTGNRSPRADSNTRAVREIEALIQNGHGADDQPFGEFSSWDGTPVPW